MSVTTTENPRGKIDWQALFLGVLVTLYGIFLLVQTAGSIERFYEAQFWRETFCTVLQIESEHAAMTKPPMNRKVKVLYAFEYAGGKYTGDQYDIVYTLYFKGEIEDLIAGHPPAAPTACYFNPLDPRESVINREISIWKFIAYFAIPTFTFGLALLLFQEAFSRFFQTKNRPV